jgi:hypothetical protein
MRNLDRPVNITNGAKAFPGSIAESVRPEV